MQAPGTTALDLPPRKYAGIGRDHEDVRHGTLSILAALDLHTGQIIANAESRHRSAEFVALLRRLDEHYPSEAIVRVVLDNHSAHISKETTAYVKRWLTWPAGQAASGACIRPSTARGST